MKTRAERFLEGFKLGSLGVSKKPKTTPHDGQSGEEEKPSDYKELSFLSFGKKGMGIYGYFSWTQNKSFFLLVWSPIAHTLDLYGSKKSPINVSFKKEITPSGSVEAKLYDMLPKTPVETANDIISKIKESQGLTIDILNNEMKTWASIRQGRPWFEAVLSKEVAEGFKLGSLGVGSKTPVIMVPEPKPPKPKKEPELPVEVKITQFTPKGPDGFQGWIGSARWMEEHVGVGTAECMLGARQIGKNYDKWGLALDITFFPGPDAPPEVVKDGGGAMRYIKILADKKETKTQFEELKKQAKTGGFTALGFGLKKLGKTIPGWKKVSMVT